MKQRLLILSISLLSASLYGAHLNLTRSNKLDFYERRSTMIQSLLTAKKAKLMRLTSRAKKYPTQRISSAIDSVKNEIIGLIRSLDVLKNSVYALRSSSDL